MNDDHKCWWTRRSESEIRDDGASIAGAGVPSSVLQQAAAVLGSTWSEEQSAEDEYGTRIVMGAIAGSTHDECFFHLTPVSAPLKEAIVRVVLRLHSVYLGEPINEQAVLPLVLEQLCAGKTIRLRTDPRRRRLTIRAYVIGAGWLARLRARRLHLDCSGRRERM